MRGELGDSSPPEQHVPLSFPRPCPTLRHRPRCHSNKAKATRRFSASARDNWGELNSPVGESKYAPQVASPRPLRLTSQTRADEAAGGSQRWRASKAARTTSHLRAGNGRNRT
eukprot:119583-Pyramimonas_sp.AAC.1